MSTVTSWPRPARARARGATRALVVALGWEAKGAINTRRSGAVTPELPRRWLVRRATPPAQGGHGGQGQGETGGDGGKDEPALEAQGSIAKLDRVRPGGNGDG